MKHILRIDEFKSVIGEAPTDKNYHVIWTNGEVFVEPDRETMMKINGGWPLNFSLDPNKKTVYASPMDDWADLKFVKRLQQALTDFKKAKLITDDWTITVSDDKETKRTLGSNKIGAVLKYDSSMVDKIPRAFHGTSSYHIEDIKRFGITPREHTDVERNWKKGYTNKSDTLVFMTMDWARAMYYAHSACNKLEKDGLKPNKPVVIQINNLPTSMVVVDDDFVSNQGMLGLMWLLQTGKKPDMNSYVQGIRMSGQFAVNQRIPPSMFTKIYMNP